MRGAHLLAFALCACACAAATGVAQRPALRTPSKAAPTALATADALAAAELRGSLVALRLATGSIALAIALVALSPVPALIARLGADTATRQLQWVAAFSAATEVVASPIVGQLIDAFGRKPVLVGSMALLGAAHGAVACVGSAGALLGAKFCASLLMGTYMLAAGAATADMLVSRPEQLAAESGLSMAVLSGGLALGVPLSSALPSRLCYHYGASAGLAAFGAAVLCARLGETLPPGARRPFEWRRSLRAPISCVRLFRHSRQLGVLSALLALQLLPLFTSDVLHVHALESWALPNADRTRLFSAIGFAAVGANSLGGALIGAVGLRAFTVLATLSHGGFWLCVSHSSRAALLATLPTILGGARSLGVSSLLATEGARSGVPQGELAGDRANLFALLKVVGPVLYGTLYSAGARAGVPTLPFLTNAGIMLVAALLCQQLLPGGRRATGGGAARLSQVARLRPSTGLRVPSGAQPALDAAANAASAAARALEVRCGGWLARSRRRLQSWRHRGARSLSLKNKR